MKVQKFFEFNFPKSPENATDVLISGENVHKPGQREGLWRFHGNGFHPEWPYYTESFCNTGVIVEHPITSDILDLAKSLNLDYVAFNRYPEYADTAYYFIAFSYNGPNILVQSTPYLEQMIKVI
jgi:hypothetical protein